MKLRLLSVLALMFILSQGAWAQEYKVQKLEEAAPSDALAPAIAQELEPAGVRVMKGQRTVVDLWLRKQWPAKAGFQPTFSVMYPFEVGTLIGVARYKNRGGDFRDQEIPAGVYTIRYAQQPVDGNHIGTSDTQDFLLLIPAADDKELGNMAASKLFPASAKAAGTTHPTMLSLLKAGEGQTPSVVEDAQRSLVSVRLEGKAKAGEKVAPLVIHVVVVGHAPE